MIIKAGNFEFTECWDGVLYKALSDYPNITDWELQTICDFIAYEESWGRKCTVEADDRSIIEALDKFQKSPHKRRVPVPEKLTECTACPKYKGCMTDIVCHTSPVENAIKIFDCGSLLSPVRARNLSAAELKAESRNAANDPEDFFEYIMFAWGNCQAGDRLVNERMLGRFPTEEELGAGFTQGVRFYFKYDKLAQHPDVVFEGVLPMKVKNEVVLKDYVHAVVVSTKHKELVEKHISEDIKDKVYYLDPGDKDIWQWSESVYDFVKSI